MAHKTIKKKGTNRMFGGPSPRNTGWYGSPRGLGGAMVDEEERKRRWPSNKPTWRDRSAYRRPKKNDS